MCTLALGRDLAVNVEDVLKQVDLLPYTRVRVCAGLKTLRDYFSSINVPLENLGNLTVQDFQAFAVSLPSAQRKDARLALTHLAQVLQLDLSPDIWAQPVHKTVRHGTLNPLDIARMNQAAQHLSLRNRSLYYLIRDTGITSREVIGMLNRHFMATKVTIVKGTKERILPISQETQESIAAYVEGKKAAPPNGPLWVARHGGPVTTLTLEQIFRQLSKQLGFTVNAEDLRRHLIHRMLAAGLGPSLVAEWFGCSSSYIMRIARAFEVEEVSVHVIA